MNSATSTRYWNKIVFVIVAAFGSAYLPPHLLTILIGKDALLLSLGMVAQEQQRIGRNVIHIEHTLPITLHAGDGGEAAAIPVVEFILLALTDEIVIVAGKSGANPLG